ncbi:MAG TPA: serine/threonine-protein kinase [Polyangiaceae bacterium]|nr:serine/threonine-protein kinase [Polyangiaceae bacterium]
MFLPSPGALVAHRFRLRHPIGKGGMGQVWEAHDKELDGPCAVKFIVDHLARDPEARLRMVREARAVARLRSPHVVNILSVGEHEDAMYLAMELLEGETLSTRLERTGKLDAQTTLALLEQVAQVLDKAHAHGVVHRDLKPDNIWLCAEPKLFVKVLDFGIAKSQRLSAGATASGALMGTPQYMSPEQANGERELDHRSDLWSLAIITMECLSGKRPYEASGLGNLLMKIMSSPPPAVHDLDPTLPASLAPWWQRALAHDPNQRFQSAAELIQALGSGLATLPSGRGPLQLDKTARGNWAEPTPAPHPQPPHVRTLVTNITPVWEPTPALRLDRAPRERETAARAQLTPQPGLTQPLSAPRERGTSVGPVTHTAQLTRPPRRRSRRWGRYAVGGLTLGAAAFALWRGVLQRSAAPPAEDGIDIHWSTLRPIHSSAEPEAPPRGEAPAAPAPAAPPAEASPLAAPQPAVPQPTAPPPVAAPFARPNTSAHKASPAATQTPAAAARRPERLRPGAPPAATVPRPPASPTSKAPDPPAGAEDAKLKERLGF